MIRLLLLAALAALAIFFGPIAMGHKGYVLIAMADWVIEMTVVSLLISLVALFALVLLVEFVVRQLLRISHQSGRWISGRKARKALAQTSEGLLAMAAQDWRGAERLLSKSAAYSHNPELNYLSAAEAARQQGNEAQLLDYMERAGSEDSLSLPGVIAKARLAVTVTAKEQAVVALQSWQKKRPRYAPLLLQLSELYVELAMWSQWLALAPQLKKQTQLPESRLAELTLQATRGLLQEKASQSEQALLEYWQSLPRLQRKSPLYLAAFCFAARHGDLETLAIESCFEMLMKTPDEALLDEWSLLAVDQPEQRLLKLKKLKISTAAQLSLLGLTAAHARRWSEASDYLERALAMRSSRRDQLALAQSYEAQGDLAQALRCYKQLEGLQ